MTPWAHIISSFRGQWIPGDARGFRNRKRRAHSSGNIDHPPEVWEHRGLRERNALASENAIELEFVHCALVGEALINKLRANGSRIGALTVSPTHCHALVEVGHGDAVKLFGKAKQLASHRLRSVHPGKLWGASSHVVRMKDDAQIETVRRYILAHRDEGAWVWPPR